MISAQVCISSEDGSEFSEDEFDPIELLECEYENLPLERPQPDGAESEEVECGADPPDRPELDLSCSSVCLADMSADSLVLPRLDTSFDRDSIDSVRTEPTDRHSGPVIQNHGEKTIILSPAVALFQAEETESQANNKVSISSSSWINIAGQETNIPTVAPSSEPVKPPRLKKLARQQSKQEMLRAKGFGVSQVPGPAGQTTANGENVHIKTIKGLNNNLVGSSSKTRPEIGPPILIGSTITTEDLQNHKCITLHRSAEPFLLHQEGGSGEEGELCSVYRAPGSDTDSSFYNEEGSASEEYSGTENANDIYNEHIYEEISENRRQVRPLPPIPEGSLGPNITKSIFTGSTKYEILHFLKNAKQRMEGNAVDFEPINEESDGHEIHSFLGNRHHKHRVSAISNLSDSSSSSRDSEVGGVVWRGLERLGGAEVERHDSGVGSDSGLSSSCLASRPAAATTCMDCEASPPEEELLCEKCAKRRGERKEIITEIVETETKYGRDLRIIMEEFYWPMLVAGLLSSDQLASIFLNVEQLIQVNTSFTTQLKDALEEAAAIGDEDLSTVKIGVLFIQAMPMLQAFEAYCTKQVDAY